MVENILSIPHCASLDSSLTSTLWVLLKKKLHNHPQCGVASASPEHILSCLRLSRETFETDPLLAFDFLRNSNLPLSFVNEVDKIVEDETIVRSNLKSVSGVYSWIEEYGRTSDTKWNLRSSRPSGTRLVCCLCLGRGGLVVGSWRQNWRASGSKQNSTEDPLFSWVCCTLNLMWVLRPATELVQEFGESSSDVILAI
ncbi:hypothetical protein AVEN_84520-1 [Araneus ventricosus]|uniref:Uncharacterized protein n=1 Tax=Araneus ventricosus TaxID=182803 RepID=A0A4Y2F993_ARAVE|nr:hypothetical protein AVEN_84520-1 [Araneus ventricosus]